MAISTLAYKITADTRGFNTNVAASRREMNLAKRVMTETESPASRLRASLNSLEAIYKKGLITSRQYADAQKRVRAEITGTVPGTSGLVKRLSGFAGVATRIVPQLAILTSGFLAVRSAIRSVSTALADIDRLGKAGLKLGIDPNALQAFEVAASRAGISTSTLETSLQRMTRKIGDAQRGTGEATNVFEALNLSVSDLAALQPDQQFLAIADKIGAMRTQTERLSATVKIFDSEGAAMVRVLGLGAEGLARTSIEAKNMLGVLRTGTVEAFNDRLADVGFTLRGFSRGFTTSIVEALLPSLELFNKLGLSLVSLGKAFGTVATIVLRVFNPAIEALTKLLPDRFAPDVSKELARFGGGAKPRGFAAVAEAGKPVSNAAILSGSVEAQKFEEAIRLGANRNRELELLRQIANNTRREPISIREVG